MSPQCMRALAAIVLVGCTSATPRVVTPEVDGDFTAAIADARTWQALAAKPGNEVLAHVEVVKVLFDREGQHLYFMQSRRWPVHFDFADRFLSPGLDHYTFNDREYHTDDRRFVLGAITHYLDQEAWTFELFAGDTYGVAPTAEVFAAIRRVVFFADQLRYRPIPETQLAVIDRVRAVMPVLTTDELFAHLKYQPLEPGEAWGTLRIVPVGAAPPVDLRPTDIVVLGTQPLELGPVAAIVTAELQAPLGHLAVLAHSRGTPDMALRDATTELAPLAGKVVHLRVGPSDYTIEPATAADLAKAKAHHAKAPAVQLDGRDGGMPALADLDPDAVAQFGAKTAQLARVAQMEGIPTPRGFGLSFHAYLAWLHANGLEREVAAHRDLAALRAKLLAAPIPPAIVDAIAARIRVVLPGAQLVRLRSSTNAEDLDGFSGAGLYHSARVDPAQRADLERGLREVWASVWSDDAFAERELWGIDHAKVAMGILVQESIEDDVVNGVAITGNPFFEGRPGVYINGQVRGGSVTGAAGNEVPEQILVYTDATVHGVERITVSSRAGGKNLMTDAEAYGFAGQLRRIHGAFTGGDLGSAKAVDVEFLVRRDRKLVVVQARPYTLHWTDDRKH